MSHLGLYAPVIGLVFFFVVFVAIAVWVLRPGAKKKLESHARIPLKEDEHERK